MNVACITRPIQYRLSLLIEHCILAVAFFLPLSLNVATLLLTAGAVLWLAKVALGGRLSFRPSPLDALIAVFVLWSAVSILSSPDPGFSYYNYYHLMGRYIVLYYLVVNNLHSVEQAKRLMVVMLCSAAAVAGYGFFQYFQGLDTSAAQWVDGEQFPELKVRVYSTLHNPNLLAGYLVAMMAVAGGLGLFMRRYTGKLLCFGLALGLGTCLVLTYSRGAWLSVMVVIMIFGVLQNRRLLWLAVLVPVFVVLGHQVVMERLVSILNPTDTSAMLRLALWESTVAMIMDKPLFGIGWGAYWMVYPQYDFFILDAGTKIFHAHNMFLHIAAEIGLPGFFAFLGLLVGHARLAFRLIGTVTDRWISGLMLGLFGALCGIAVSGMTDYILFSTQMSMLFWLLCAVIVAVHLSVQRQSS